MVYRIADIHLPLDGTMEDLSNLAAETAGGVAGGSAESKAVQEVCGCAQKE